LHSEYWTPAAAFFPSITKSFYIYISGEGINKEKRKIASLRIAHVAML
jgi:hypothetical protein